MARPPLEGHNRSPSTVTFLLTLGHDIVRVDAVLPKTASDEEIVAGRPEFLGFS